MLFSNQCLDKVLVFFYIDHYLMQLQQKNLAAHLYWLSYRHVHV